MALYPDHTLTPSLLQALEALIAEIPADDLIGLARRNPRIFKGFQLKPAAAQNLRRRLLQSVTGAGEIEASLRSFLAERSFNAEWVSVLSLATLEYGLRIFASLFSRESFLLGMLLDAREPVRALAAAHTGANAPFQLLPREKAIEGLQKRFAPLLKILGEAFTRPSPDAPATPPVTPDPRVAKLEQQLRELRSRAVKRRAVERRLERSEAQGEAHRETNLRLARELTALHQLCDAATQRAERAEEALAGLATAQEQRIDTAVREQLEGLSRRWLRRAETLEAGLDDPRPEDLLARADAILAQQATVDRHSGNRRALQKRLLELENALQKLRTAQSEAISPLAALGDLQRELAAETARLQALLGSAPESPIAALLAARIATADPAMLAELRALIEQLALLTALPEATCIDLHRRIQDRQALALAAEGLDLPDRQTDPGTPSARLAALLNGRTPGHLLIDGHNVLLRSPGRYAPYLGPDGAPDRAAREALIRDLRDLTAPGHPLRVRCFFDSPTRDEQDITPHLQVVFSGGSGEDRADHAILDYATFLQQAGEGLTALVSDDQALARQARALGALTVSVAEFLAWLS